jgi:hypothetical protein
MENDRIMQNWWWEICSTEKGNGMHAYVDSGEVQDHSEADQKDNSEGYVAVTG